MRIGTLLLHHTCTLLITRYSTKFRNMVRLVIKFLSNKVWDVFLVLKQ